MDPVAIIIIVAISVLGLFVALPWLVFHYVTRWKAQATLTTEDENLLDELHELARRLDDRMRSIERILDAENPGWRHVGQDPVEDLLEDRADRLHELSERVARPARTRRKS
jgi:phage shock protein B